MSGLKSNSMEFGFCIDHFISNICTYLHNVYKTLPCLFKVIFLDCQMDKTIWDKDIYNLTNTFIFYAEINAQSSTIRSPHCLFLWGLKSKERFGSAQLSLVTWHTISTHFQPYSWIEPHCALNISQKLMLKQYKNPAQIQTPVKKKH